MCGVAAIYAYQDDAPPVSRDELLAIRDRMHTRGPDGEGLWLTPDGRVALAHRRLSIIDLSSGGAQPMGTPDGLLQIVFNGEIYNYRALRQHLKSRGVQLRSQSDTEVLLHLYAEIGPNFVRELRGMFAFALWDTRKKGLLLARDPFGIKPLYFADDGKTIRIASQVKALLAGGRISRLPDPAGVVGFHLWGSVPEPFTLYSDIQVLPAGHTLWIDRDRGVDKSVAFYELPFSRDPQSDHKPNPELRDALIDTVRHHREADVPVGVFLSSGLDSATLMAISAELAPEGLHTVTLGFEELKGTPADEVPLAEKLAARYGTDHHTVMVSRNDFKRELPRLLDAMDQPSIDGVNAYFVSLAAARAGLKVALSGLGGDELFGSYPSFSQIPMLVSALAPLHSLPMVGRSFRNLTSSWIGRWASPKLAGLLEYGPTLEGAYLLRRGLYMPWELSEFLDPDEVREGLRRLDLMMGLASLDQGITDTYWRISALELGQYMRNQLLRDADWAGMAHSLEIRVPFIDPVFVDAVYRLKSRNPHLRKATLAEIPAKPLPAAVWRRPKSGFSIPVQEWASEELGVEGSHGLRGWARFLFGQFSKISVEP